MIIFYNNKNGEIYGMIEGRVHDQATIDKNSIRPANVNEEDISKYVVSFTTLTRKVKKARYANFVNPKTLEIQQKQVGEVEVEVGVGMEMTDKFSKVLTNVENGKDRINRYKFVINNGKVTKLVLKDEDRTKTNIKPNNGSKEDLLEKVRDLQDQIFKLRRVVHGILEQMPPKLDANK